MTYTYSCVYSARLLMMDRETVRKNVEFYSKNKLEKLVHLVGFIIVKGFFLFSKSSRSSVGPYKPPS